MFRPPLRIFIVTLAACAVLGSGGAAASQAAVTAPIALKSKVVATAPGLTFTLRAGRRLDVAFTKDRRGRRVAARVRGRMAYLYCEGISAGNTSIHTQAGMFRWPSAAPGRRLRLRVAILPTVCGLGDDRNFNVAAVFRNTVALGTSGSTGPSPQYLTELLVADDLVGQALAAISTLPPAQERPTAQQVISRIQVSSSETRYTPPLPLAPLANPTAPPQAGQLGLFVDLQGIGVRAALLHSDGTRINSFWNPRGFRVLR